LFTGIATAVFRGDRDGWRRDRCDIYLPGSWDSITNGIAGVGLAAIEAVGGNADTAGWAVDKSGLYLNPNRHVIFCDLAVRQRSISILRLSYHATVQGRGYKPVIF
jgi:hypothetical protein